MQRKENSLLATCLLAAGAAVLTATLGACDGDDDVGSAATSSSGAAASSGAVTSSGAAATSSGSAATSSGSVEPAATAVVYVESNDPGAGANGVLAWRRLPAGALEPLPGSPFLTGGSGIANPTQMLGPNDSDQEIVTTPDHRRLFAVNTGSDTIAVMDIDSDGSLTAIAGSPFPSGGAHPVSVGLAGDRLVVVNQGDTAMDAGATTANYVMMRVAENGALSPIAGAVLPAGKSPSQALIARGGQLLFGADFMAPLDTVAPAPPLRSFVLGASTLTEAPGSPLAIPTMDGGMPPGLPAALGLWQHPSQDVLYVGHVMRGEVGVYGYAASGALSFTAAAPVTGPAPCWLRTNAVGDRLYVTTTGDNSMSVLDTSNPAQPMELQHLQLAEAGPTFVAMGMTLTSSQSFQLELSPDGRALYVVSQRATPDAAVTQGNYLHRLEVATDGRVAETMPPIALPVAPTTRPHGVVVF